MDILANGNLDAFDLISPLDHRYWVSDPELLSRLSKYLSERAGVQYQFKVEAALARALARRGLCPDSCAEEIVRACGEVDVVEVYEEEKITRHNIRALVNCIRRRVSPQARPFVHLTATSMDVVDTARSLQHRDASLEVVIPLLLDLERVLIGLARREAATPQIGRTHGQHAVPITFGFAMAEYVSRLGGRIVNLERAARSLPGKFSGAVGAYNAGSLFFPDPEEFETEVLELLGLEARTHSTQIVEPEPATDYVHALASTFGVLANLADDMRHLQRSEIAEVAEAFGSNQVGSSTMPHKRNPWNFENVKSMWKAFVPRIITAYMDQISEHQRDLTNSASARFTVELVAGLCISASRVTRVMSRLVVDPANMENNLRKNAGMIIAEPLYILLASAGHPDAHEAVRKLTIEAEKSGRSLHHVLEAHPELESYLSNLDDDKRAVLRDPLKYTGRAAEKAVRVCDYWEKELNL